jgi:type IV pilus assembly protein PilM
MSFVDSIRRLVTDPPPGHVFEISPGGIAYGVPTAPESTGFRALAEGVLAISPLSDNVKIPEAFADGLAQTFPDSMGNGKKDKPAALILPDYSSRLQVLDFDTFPAKPEEQQALVRFRMKKTVPFDIETAAVSFYAQPPSGDSKKVEVVAVLVAYEILGRYEAPLREAGYQPGLVTTSALATLNLIKMNELSLLVKLSGKTLTILALDGSRIKMARCLELEALAEEEVLAVIYPTIAYMEDAFTGKSKSGRPARIWLCGFGASASELARKWSEELNIPFEILQSRYGTPGPYNAGVMGFLESAN